jgi:hypothetical protein
MRFRHDDKCIGYKRIYTLIGKFKRARTYLHDDAPSGRSLILTKIYFQVPEIWRFQNKQGIGTGKIAYKMRVRRVNYRLHNDMRPNFVMMESGNVCSVESNTLKSIGIANTVKTLLSTTTVGMYYCKYSYNTLIYNDCRYVLLQIQL